MSDPCEVAWRRRPGLARSAAAPRQSPRQVRPRYHASTCELPASFERKFNVVFPSQAYPNTAQSCGNELYRVPEIVTLGRLPGEGESDSRWRTKEVRHVGSDTLTPGF